MRLGGRLAAAIDVLEDIERRHRPVAEALKDWGVSHRFAGSGDRSAIGNIVYDALRRKRSAGWLLGADTPRAIGFGALLLEWNQTPQSLNEALEGDKFAPPLLTGEELAAVDVPPPGRRACRNSRRLSRLVRAAARSLLRRGMGRRGRRAVDAAAARPSRQHAEGQPRPHPFRTGGCRSRRNAARAERHPHSADRRLRPPSQRPDRAGLPEGLVRGAGRGLADRRRTGRRAPPACRCSTIAPAPAARRWPCPPQWKTAARSSPTIPTSPGWRRSSIACGAPKRAMSRSLSKPQELAPLAGQMDLVLVDAPCTGSGTWRRRPDAKWRLTPRAARCPDRRTGGDPRRRQRLRETRRPPGLCHLLGLRCRKWRPDRGVSRALADFEPVDHRALWNARFAGQADAARIDAERGISLTPARSGTDGFFFCLLSRVS